MHSVSFAYHLQLWVVQREDNLINDFRDWKEQGSLQAQQGQSTVFPFQITPTSITYASCLASTRQRHGYLSIWHRELWSLWMSQLAVTWAFFCSTCRYLILNTFRVSSWTLWEIWGRAKPLTNFFTLITRAVIAPWTPAIWGTLNNKEL